MMPQEGQGGLWVGGGSMSTVPSERGGILRAQWGRGPSVSKEYELRLQIMPPPLAGSRRVTLPFCASVSLLVEDPSPGLVRTESCWAHGSPGCHCQPSRHVGLGPGGSRLLRSIHKLFLHPYDVQTPCGHQVWGWGEEETKPGPCSGRPDPRR